MDAKEIKSALKEAKENLDAKDFKSAVRRCKVILIELYKSLFIYFCPFY